MLLKRRECCHGFVAASFSLINWDVAALSLRALWFLRTPVLRLDSHKSRGLCQLQGHVDVDKLPIFLLNASFYINSCNNVLNWLAVISLQNDIYMRSFSTYILGKEKGPLQPWSLWRDSETRQRFITESFWTRTVKCGIVLLTNVQARCLAIVVTFLSTQHLRLAHDDFVSPLWG